LEIKKVPQELVKITMETVTDLNAPKKGITTPIGLQLPGGTLLFSLTILEEDAIT